MEMQSLKLVVTDDDLAALLALAPPPGDPIEDLEAGFTPEGVAVSGRYPTPFFPVAFETLWQVAAAGPVVRAKLASVRVLGLPGNVLGGALMKMIRDAVEGKPGVRVEDDSVVIHLAEAVKPHGIDLVVNFISVRLSEGAALIESGPPVS